MSIYGSQVNLVPDDPEGHGHGISVITACLFIVGEIAGTGILALPEAIKYCGWSGPVAIIVVCIIFGFSGVLLGECWNIIESKDESLKTTKTRNAYALIGQRAAGKLGEYATNISFVIQMFGICVVLLLLLAGIVERLCKPIGIHMTFCEWTILIALILLPFTFAGSPVDFWPVAVSAMSSTAIASLLLIIEITRQNLTKSSETPVDEVTTVATESPTTNTTIAETITTTVTTTVPPLIVSTISSLVNGTSGPPGKGEEFVITFKTYFLGISTMCFGFSGASAMPTIQNDMKDKSKFTIAVIVGFILLIFIYLPVAIVGYSFYGPATASNIVENLDPSVLSVTIDILMSIHVFSAYLIIANPINLFLENWLKVPHCKYFFSHLF